MAKQGIQKHVHKLKRIRFKSGNATLFCVLPDCTYKISPQLALGKRNECWRCGQEHLLNEYSIRLAKPHCESCHKPKGFIAPQVNQTVASDEIQQTIKTDSMSLSDRLTSIIRGTNSEANQTGDEDI